MSGTNDLTAVRLWARGRGRAAEFEGSEGRSGATLREAGGLVARYASVASAALALAAGFVRWRHEATPDAPPEKKRRRATRKRVKLRV